MCHWPQTLNLPVHSKRQYHSNVCDDAHECMPFQTNTPNGHKMVTIYWSGALAGEYTHNDIPFHRVLWYTPNSTKKNCIMYNDIHLNNIIWHLTDWGRVTHIWVSKVTIFCSDNGLVGLVGAWLAPSHYLNQCWYIVNSNCRNKRQWKFNRNLNIFIKEMHLEMSSAKRRPFSLGLNVLTFRWGKWKCLPLFALDFKIYLNQLRWRQSWDNKMCENKRMWYGVPIWRIIPLGDI